MCVFVFYSWPSTSRLRARLRLGVGVAKIVTFAKYSVYKLNVMRVLTFAENMFN